MKVASDYLIGTFGGVAYGGALAILTLPSWTAIGILL